MLQNLKYRPPNLLFILLISTLPLYPAHKISKIIQVPYGGMKGIAINKTFSGNYGITSFSIISSEEIALLSCVENKIRIYNIKSNQLTGEFFVGATPRDFIYSHDQFYVLFEYRIEGYLPDGTKIIDFPINKNFRFIDSIEFNNNSIYLFTSDGMTHKVFEDGLPLGLDKQLENPIKGWILSNNNAYKVEKNGDFEFILYCYRENRLLEEVTFNVENKLGCISIIGVANGMLYLDVQYISKEIPLEVKRNIMTFSLQTHEIKDEFELPNSYYIYMKRDLLVHDADLYHMITTEENLSILKLGYEESLSKTIYPDEFIRYYHYNDHLPKIESEVYQQKSSRVSGLVYSSIKRSEIMSNADAYVSVQWYCSPENTTNHELIRLPDSAYIRTPAWVIVGDKTAVPYKWGGFTHINNFTNRISGGAYAGDDYTSRTDPWSVSYGDTYCVGLDCSGYISRVWGLDSKEWTGSLPDISIRRQYWANALKGDIVNKSGSHVMLVVENNPSGTIDVAHASGYDWKVAYWTFTIADLIGYIPMKYMYVINDIKEEGSETGLYQNYPNPFRETTTISFYLPDPSEVSLKVYNLNGQAVRTLFEGTVSAGFHSLEWNVGKLPAGIYFYNLTTNKSTKIRRCVIMK